MKRALIVGAALASLVVGCTDTPTPRQDLPDSHVEVNQGERLVYLSPDQFPNVVAWCDGTTRLYVTTRDSQPLVAVPNHPFCPSG